MLLISPVQLWNARGAWESEGAAAASTARVRGDGVMATACLAATGRLRCDGVEQTPPTCGRWYGANAIDASRGETDLSLVLW